MRAISFEEMQSIDGGSWADFFTGMACGATVVGAIASWVSPDPLSKIAAYSLTVGAITCVGGILAS
jgi:hypothetical protein